MTPKSICSWCYYTVYPWEQVNYVDLLSSFLYPGLWEYVSLICEVVVICYYIQDGFFQFSSKISLHRIHFQKGIIGTFHQIKFCGDMSWEPHYFSGPMRSSFLYPNDICHMRGAMAKMTSIAMPNMKTLSYHACPLSTGHSTVDQIVNPTNSCPLDNI